MDEIINKPSFSREVPNKLKFGTSGIRGLVTDMTDLECYINARGFIRYELATGDIKKGEMISIAGDFRASTVRIMVAVAAAIEDSGCKVDNCGFIPTQALAYYAMQKGQSGLMITGSHIPEDRNGIKPYRKNGEVLKTDEAGILSYVAKTREEEYLKTANGSLFNESGMFKKARSLNPVNNAAEVLYVRRYLDVFTSDCLSGKTIVLYEHSAIGRDLLARVLKGLGAEVVPVNRSKKFVALDTENITDDNRKLFRQLAKEYKSSGMFALVSTDGDSDRPLMVDEQGEFHRGDVAGILVAQYLGADFAAVPISVNDAVDIQLAKDSIEYTHTKIGSPYVIAAMKEAIARGSQKVVGWEVNGGFLTGTDFVLNGKLLKALPTRDAFLPIIGVMLQAIKKNIPVSALFSQLPRRYSQAGLIDNYPVLTSEKIMENLSLMPGDTITQVEFTDTGVKVLDGIGRIRQLNNQDHVALIALRKRKNLERYFNSNLGFSDIVRINFFDGIKISFTNRDVGHIRPSGNAPQLRFYANSDSQERADQIVQLAVADPGGILRQMERELDTTGW